MEIHIDNSGLDKHKKWWDSMSIDERKDFLQKNGWGDINWSNYKWNKLHTGLMVFINKIKNVKK